LDEERAHADQLAAALSNILEDYEDASLEWSDDDVMKRAERIKVESRQALTEYREWKE